MMVYEPHLDEYAVHRIFVQMRFKDRKEQSCLASHGHTASSALDLFDTACGTKPERLFDYAKVMKP